MAELYARPFFGLLLDLIQQREHRLAISIFYYTGTCSVEPVFLANRVQEPATGLPSDLIRRLARAPAHVYESRSGKPTVSPCVVSPQ